jgi:hypothetical protein
MSYTDMRGVFLFKKALTYQRLQRMGDNDAENHLPSGTVWEFFQAAAPTGWIKQTVENDKACRVVSGTSGGTSGGSLAPSVGLVLAHTHTVDAHNHSWPNHQHILNYTTSGVFNMGTSPVGTIAADDTQIGTQSGGALTMVRHLKNQFKNDGSGVNSGDASPATNSQLSTLIPKYADVIVCVKV